MKIKKILFTLYFYAYPQERASYSYKLKRVFVNFRFVIKKLFLKDKFVLTTQEIVTRNRGDQAITLNEEIVKEQFPILQKYLTFITKEVLGEDKKKSILDVGSREGWLLRKLAEEGFTDVTGFEVVPDWVTYCHSQGMPYIHEVNLLELPHTYKKKFDLVFSRHTLEHVDRPELFFDKLINLVTPGGIAFIVFPLNERPNFKHPSYIPSITYVKNNFNFSPCADVKLCFLKDLNYNKTAFDLTDDREKNEVVILAKKK